MENKVVTRHYFAVIVKDEVVIKQATKAALEELRLYYTDNKDNGAKALDLWAENSKDAFNRIQSVYTDVKRVKNGRGTSHTDEITEFTL